MHGSMRRGLETEHPAMVTQRSGPQGKPGEKWLRDLTPDNATAPAPDPTRYNAGVRQRSRGRRPAAGRATRARYPIHLLRRSK